MWCDILIQSLANLISGALAAFIFFVFSDYIFKNPDLDGHWNFTTKTIQSALKTFEEMTMTYTVLIWTDGKNIYGTGEKISEYSKAKEFIEHIGDDRTQVKISGYVEKKYLSKDKIIIHLEEAGKIRESSSIHLLKVEGKTIKGTFIATAADSSGTVIWTKVSPKV